MKKYKKYPELNAHVRGRGLMQGIACGVDGLAEKVCAAAFERGLLMETSGPNSEVFKLFPPLTIDDLGLEQGFDIIEESIRHSIGK